MKTSFTTMATPGLDVFEQIALAKKYGFSGVDFRVASNGNGEIPQDLSEEEAGKIRENLQGVALPGLLCYNKNIHSGQDAMVESILSNLRLAQKLQIPTIRVFSGKLQTDAEREAVVAALQEVLQHDDSPVVLTLQNHSGSGVTLQQGLEICRSIASKRVGVIVSPDHTMKAGEDLFRILPEVAPYATQMYVADVDENFKLVPIGEGIVDFSRTLDVLHANGFAGFVTLKWEKCWHPELQDYSVGFDSFLRWVDTYESRF